MKDGPEEHTRPMDKYLKKYLKDNFCFKDLKKAGFYSKEIKATDYEKQAERICQFYSLKNVYDFSKMGVGTRYHITEVEPTSLSFSGTIRDTFGENILNTLTVNNKTMQKP